MSSNKPHKDVVQEDEIVLNHVWKIFGTRAKEALAALESEQLEKNEVLERFDAVVGVSDVSLSIKKGEIFCIMGLSGSGKSTLVRHINRLLEPTSGQIKIAGTDVMTLAPNALRELRSRQIGMVFQNFGLMPHRTVRDNVALPLEVRKVDKITRRSRAQDAIDLVELTGWEDRYAHELSGGMQQRVGLARALAANPAILLMDEPFSALDPLIRRQLQDQFMKLSDKMKKTTVFITHDLDEAIRIGDRIAIMKDGKIIQVGTPETIVTEPADEYVKDFVAGISRLKLVFSHTVMQPIDKYEKEHGKVPKGATHCVENESLDSLIGKMLIDDGPLLVLDLKNQPVGVITSKDLLRGIQGNK